MLLLIGLSDVDFTCFQADLLGGRTKEHLTPTFMNKTGTKNMSTVSTLWYCKYESVPRSETNARTLHIMQHNKTRHNDKLHYNLTNFFLQIYEFLKD